MIITIIIIIVSIIIIITIITVIFSIIVFEGLLAISFSAGEGLDICANSSGFRATS